MSNGNNLFVSRGKAVRVRLPKFDPIYPALVQVCLATLRCIPFRYRSSSKCDGTGFERVVEVLMINSTSGPGLLFPKGGWENDETVEEAAIREAIEEAGVKGELLDCLGYYNFKSKTLQDECSPEGLCKAAVFPLLVKEELQSWPEQNTRKRTWLTVTQALGCCRHPWMRQALEEGFLNWHIARTTTHAGPHMDGSSPSPGPSRRLQG